MAVVLLRLIEVSPVLIAICGVVWYFTRQRRNSERSEQTKINRELSNAAKSLWYVVIASGAAVTIAAAVWVVAYILHHLPS